MPFSLDYNDVLPKFDELVKQHIVLYVEPKIIYLKQEELDFEFRISGSLTGKPQAEDALRIPSPQQGEDDPIRPECFGPGSDIANEHPDLLVQSIHDTHLLVINKFPLFRPHLLLLTVDSYRRQDEALTSEDFRAAWTVLQVAGLEFYALFNCTPTAGASRWHKHMQVIPKPENFNGGSNDFRFFPDYALPLTDKIPFAYFIQHFKALPEDVDTASEQIFRLYLELYSLTRESLNITSEDLVCPHNVILTRKWIISIPRRSKDFHGITANGAGMMGSVWLMSDNQLDDWKTRGPERVLSALGVPAAKCIKER